MENTLIVLSLYYTCIGELHLKLSGSSNVFNARISSFEPLWKNIFTIFKMHSICAVDPVEKHCHFIVMIKDNLKCLRDQIMQPNITSHTLSKGHDIL